MDTYKNYKCVLNQTNIKTNSNKFYTIEIQTDGKDYYLKNVYGRLGESGKTITKKYDEKKAISEFKKKFKAKTKNTWSNNIYDTFVKHANLYYLTQLDDCKDDNKDNGNNNSKDNGNNNSEDNAIILKTSKILSKLDVKLQELFELITGKDMFNTSMKNIGIKLNLKNTCLGSISINQINKAYDVLEEIAKNVNNPNYDLMEASNQFYTYIPQNSGRNKLPQIESELLSTLYEGLQELLDINVSNSIITNNTNNLHKYDSIYNDLNCKIEILDKNTDMYRELKLYIDNTKSPVHNYRTSVIDIYKINRGDDEILYNNYCESLGEYGNNKMLLFHGSNLCNWISIFKNNLYLNPASVLPNVHISGKMFGYGVYFADLHTKSVGYCGTPHNGYILLLVAEVCVGKQWIKYDADYYANRNIKKTDYNSVFARGLYGTYQNGENKENDDIIIPNEKVKKYKEFGKYNERTIPLYHNEYIVYDENSWVFRYIIKLKVE